MNADLIPKSKYVSYTLRHTGIVDKNGWLDVDTLLCMAKFPFSKSELEIVVKENDKQRFEYNEDQTKIRARQGHSVAVDVELNKGIPPATLYHGTKEEYLPSIKKYGLEKRNRNHVHLSDNKETALQVANRRKGKSIILEVDAMQMRALNYNFYISNNNVWLTDIVPIKFLTFPK